MSSRTKVAIERYLTQRMRGLDPQGSDVDRGAVKKRFASLIGADVDSIAFVQSTTAAENTIVNALKIRERRRNIVTDELHFRGSLYLYEQLARRGVDVRVVRARDWQIDMADVSAAIDDNTGLVAVSHVSFVNGFQHDLAALSALAHASGAYVYADIIQSAGAIPVDVAGMGIDFCACASYKWLMGDFGLGFAYVRPGMPRTDLHQVHFGWREAVRPRTDGEEATVADYFEIGTFSLEAVSALAASLEYLEALGVENIQRYVQYLVGYARAEISRSGYHCLTPEHSNTPIIAYALDRPNDVWARLRDAKVDVTIVDDRLRISPSFYNDVNDIHALVEALS
jgi:selenocysteine lyase/cysteine desulfurase